MKWQEIYDILLHFDEECKKGWYSYTFANRIVPVARESVPGIIYELPEYNYGYPATFGYKKILEEKNDEVRWIWPKGDIVSFDDLPDADDYYIANEVFHQYIVMVHITNIADASKALRNMADIINRQEVALYNNKQSYMQNVDTIFTSCGFCGIGFNDKSQLCFYADDGDFSIRTARSLANENKHRRHFKEREWLFPYISNGFDSEDTLYVQTSSLIGYKGKMLKQQKEKLEDTLRKLLNEAEIEYELVEIKKPYKNKR